MISVKNNHHCRFHTRGHMEMIIIRNEEIGFEGALSFRSFANAGANGADGLIPCSPVSNFLDKKS